MNKVKDLPTIETVFASLTNGSLDGFIFDFKMLIKKAIRNVELSKKSNDTAKKDLPLEDAIVLELMYWMVNDLGYDSSKIKPFTPIDDSLNIEALAAIQHDIWAHWMKYQFSCCKWDVLNGTAIIPADKLERWNRQVKTSYAQLSEKEKESDREQVRKFLHLVKPL